MAGLVDSTKGLSYTVGHGLIFESGLGGVSLTNPPNGVFIIPATATFAGAGGLSATGALRLRASAQFAGSGSLKQ